VGISGASGGLLGVRLLEELLLRPLEVHCVLTAPAELIMKKELGLDRQGLRRRFRAELRDKSLRLYADSELAAPIASGSFRTEAMVVAPCSVKTLSGIAHGYASGLLERAADVHIKERRLLVLAPREMPFSVLHLECMLRLARLGVVIAPPVMGLYPRPKSVKEMVDFLVGKLLDALGLEHELYRRWEG